MGDDDCHDRGIGEACPKRSADALRETLRDSAGDGPGGNTRTAPGISSGRMVGVLRSSFRGFLLSFSHPCWK